MAAQKGCDKHQEQRRAAVAAYASAQGARAGECISSEEMACLVEGEMDQRRREVLLEHIGWCSRCYDEWLVLKAETPRRSKAKPAHALLRLLTTGRGLAIAGSALSVAAAVVVFLNLDPAQRIGETAEEGAMKVQVEKDDAFSKMEAGDAVQSSRQEKPAAIMEEKEIGKTPRFHEPGRQRLQEAPAEKQVPAGRQAYRSAAAENVLYDTILQGCQRGEEDTVFWQGLHEALAAGQRHAELAGLLGRLAATGDAERLCPRVVALLRNKQGAGAK